MQFSAAVAVAYQVVFVIDTDDTDDNVAIPQNLAGALNYDCVNCLTYAIAQQLFVTLDDPLSDDAMAKLDVVWDRIAAYEAQIEAGEVPPDEVTGRLNEFTGEIKAIVEEDQPGTFPTATQASSAAQPSNSTAASAPSQPTATASPTPTAPAAGGAASSP